MTHKLNKTDNKMTNKHTFVRISNEDVYAKLLEIDIKLSGLTSQIKINKWTAATALFIVIGVLIKVVMSK